MSGTITGTKISALPAAQTITNTDTLPLDQNISGNWATNGAQMQQVYTYMQTAAAALNSTIATVSAAGSSLATATVLTARYNAVTGGTGGVALPAVLGARISVYNFSGASIIVYPNTSSQQIDSSGAGVGKTVNNGSVYHAVAFSATQAYTD